MLKYIPYILLFPLATMIIYAWGLWRSVRQNQDLSNLLAAKGVSKVKKALRKKKRTDLKRAGALRKRSDREAALQPAADCRNRPERISEFHPAVYGTAKNDNRK